MSGPTDGRAHPPNTAGRISSISESAEQASDDWRNDLKLKMLLVVIGAVAAILFPSSAFAQPVEVGPCDAGYSGAYIRNVNPYTGDTTVWACVKDPN